MFVNIYINIETIKYHILPFFYFLGLFPMLLESFHNVCACACLKLFSMYFLLSVLVSGLTILRSVIHCELTLMYGERQRSRFILLCLETSYLTPVLKLAVLSPMYVFENLAKNYMSALVWTRSLCTVHPVPPSSIAWNTSAVSYHMPWIAVCLLCRQGILLSSKYNGLIPENKTS